MSSRSISTERLAPACVGAGVRKVRRVVLRGGRPLAAAVALLLGVASGAGTAFAVDWERMVMPGPLSKAHADLEKDCGKCHKAFEGGAERDRCLACHEEVAADVRAKSGYHGRQTMATNGPCRSCHGEHKGREADIRGLSEATFDHDRTDHPLRGAHAHVACNDCHAAGKRRDAAPHDCLGCHRKDDPHGDAMSDDCQSCHEETRWATTRFDHSKTKYPLTGAHAKASCDGCHAAQRFKGTPTTCVSCHAIDDAHGGRFGQTCADCHTTTSWGRKDFDHARQSGFPLVGAHGSARCDSCHHQPPGSKEKLPKDCAGCHRTDDVHAGRFGTKCDSCHTAVAWRGKRFDHATQTKFPLMDAHAKVACDACHTKKLAPGQKTDRACVACHAKDDVHRNALGKSCDDCHDQRDFAGRVRFDHDQTAFPLLGLHAAASCEACHVDRTFKRDAANCRACHAGDDAHKGTLGRGCEVCHNPNGWMLWRFDHDRKTRFKLAGAHAGIACNGCHQKPMEGGFQMAQRCVDCHESDDAHRGRYGRGCQNCHSDAAWKPARIRRSGG